MNENPDRARLHGLALSDTGFLFDPLTGHMYTLNRTGAELLKWLREGVPESALPDRVASFFEVTSADAEPDCARFVKTLRDLRLLEP